MAEQSNKSIKGMAMETEAKMKECERQRVGRYELGRTIGHGAFAKVKFGRNLETGKSVAIKVIDKDRVHMGGKVDQIKREISIMKLVKHPNVVQLYEVMASKKKIYFVMEYVNGGELFDKVVYQKKLREEEAKTYFQQLIHALDFCHSRGVCHRDLKPENLLLDGHGKLKIADFGLSALPDQARKDGLLHTACGTPTYVAPEVILNKGYDGAKADLWSCGVILFVLLAGYLPFSDANLRVLYRKIQFGHFKCPPWFSPNARNLVHKLLEPDPKRRLTIPELMNYHWFRNGYRPLKQYIVEDDETPVATSENPIQSGIDQKPGFMNAFELISFSPGLNLSGLFEERQDMKRESRFTSKFPASTIFSKLEEIAKILGLSKKRQSECLIKFQGIRFAFVAEVFQIAPSCLIVELRNTGGDGLEYQKFYDRKLRPTLSEIVWTWIPS
eukprot:Gb_25620 [translate_table: standard]